MMQLGEKVETNDNYWVFGTTYLTVRETTRVGSYRSCLVQLPN